MPTTSRHVRSLFAAAAIALVLSGCTTMFTPRSRRPAAGAAAIPNMPMLKWGIESCGAGSLATVLQHYGDTTSMAALDAELPKTHGGVLTIDMLIGARSKGYDARIITAGADTVATELRQGRPVILMLKVIDALGREYDFFHYVVADGIDARGVIRVQFGDGRGRWVTFDRLEKAWAGGSHTAILVRPHDPITDSLRAAVELEEQGKYDEAAASYRTLLASHPDSAVAWTNLGNVEMQRKRNREAEEAFRQALQIDPRSRDAMNNLAWLLFQEKRLGEAESFARTAAAEPGPDTYLILDTLARILAAKGSCAEAASTFRQAIDGVPASRPEAKRDLESARAEAATACRS